MVKHPADLVYRWHMLQVVLLIAENRGISRGLVDEYATAITAATAAAARVRRGAIRLRAGGA
jgi:hypothetical protein